MRLIIDTDAATGVIHDGRARDIDDGFAIIETLNDSAFDLVGITTVYGNAPLPDVNRVAREIVDMKASGTPIHHGAASKDDTGTNDAVEFIAEQLRLGPLHIAAIGPLTNMGLLVDRHPELIASIESVVVVAGRTAGNDFFIGDVGPVNDFNFENDPVSARKLIDSGVPTVCAGFELTSQVALTRESIEQIKDRGEVGAYCHERSQAWFDFWLDRFPADEGFHPWDSAAMAWLGHPEWFTHEIRGCHVDLEPETPRMDTFTPVNDKPVTFLTGFRGDGAKQFIDSVIRNIY